MYEHPIKRAGLSMNRIIFSNTRMVQQGFPALKPQQFDLRFKFRTYKDGKVISSECKSLRTLTVDRLRQRQPGRRPSLPQGRVTILRLKLFNSQFRPIVLLEEPLQIGL